MKRLINKLPITRIKILFARLIYQILHLVYPDDRRIISRGGIKYEIDLSEGIDLSIFLFGGFQKHVSQNKRLSLPGDAVIFDVGANFGAMTLPFAKLVPLGKVYAFEPTFYAFSKLKKNLELNPELAQRVVPVQSFVSSNTSQGSHLRAYASWKIGGSTEGPRHRIHRGIPKPADGIPAISLDDFCRQNGIERLDFIKIDTDGHELEVLKGAQKSIDKFKPVIIFEVGIYVMEEANIDFSEYLKFFGFLNYSLFNSTGLSGLRSRSYFSGVDKEITENNYYKYIPAKGTIDILAVPNIRL